MDPVKLLVNGHLLRANAALWRHHDGTCWSAQAYQQAFIASGARHRSHKPGTLA